MKILVNQEGTISVVDFTKNPRTKNVMKKTGKIEFEETVEEIDDPMSSRASAKMSFSQRAFSIFKGKPIEWTFEASEPINNKNILMLSDKNEYLYNAFNMKEWNQNINR